MSQLKKQFWAMALPLVAPAAFAQDGNDLDLGAPADGPLAAIGGFFQEVVDFAGGPGALLLVFVSLLCAIGLWVAAPKAGGAGIAWAMRALIGGILVFNIALAIGWMQSF